MIVAVFFSCLLLLRVLQWFLFDTSHPKRFPPGPRFALPLVGDAIALVKKDPFVKLRQKYGDAVGFWLGQIRTVVVSSYDLIQEVGSNDFCQDRIYVPDAPLIRGAFLNDGTLPGLMSAEGNNWSEMRRFTLQTLRSFGLGKASMEVIIQDELKELLADFESLGGKAFNVEQDLVISILNNLWRIVTNERLQRSDPKIVDIKAKMERMLKEVMNPLSRIFFEYRFLRWLNQYLKVSQIEETFQDLLEFVQPCIKEHEQEFQKDQVRDFIDVFLNKGYEDVQTNEASRFAFHDGHHNLTNILVDLFIAGAGSTTSTIYWGLLYMINHPEIQRKAQEELDKVTGKTRLPCLEDQDNTPYTNAIIQEVQRLGNVIPFSIPHSNNTSEVIFGSSKHRLPKRTHIMIDIGSAHFNPEEFPNPSKFDPSRYIDDAGKFKPHPHVIPFGLGKRRCIGESLAKQSLYIYFTGMLSTFDILPEDQDHYPDPGKVTIGAVRSPSSYKLRLYRRT